MSAFDDAIQETLREYDDAATRALPDYDAAPWGLYDDAAG